MSKLNVVQNNFTAGELSPSMFGRFDYARYNNGAKTLKNVIPMIQGGVKKRGGTEFIGGSISAATNKYRIVPFVYDSNTAYILIFDGTYIRFYKDKTAVFSGGSPYKIAFSLSTTARENFKYIQIGNKLILVDGETYPRYIERLGETNWVTGYLEYEVPPTIEGEFKNFGFCNETLAYATSQITLGSTGTGGWLASDVGRQVQFDDGSLVTITNIVSTTVADVSNIVTPSVATYAAKTWRLLDSPQTSLSIPFAASKITTCTATAAAFRAIDVGRIIITPDAAYKITAYTSSTVVTVRILETKISTTDTPAAGAWTLESFVFSADYGFPKAVTFFEGRLIFGGLTNLPTNIWASKSGQQKNFRLGTADDSAFSFDLASGRNEQIVSLASDKTLLAFTYDSVISLNGGNSDPLTPTNVQKRVQSSRGCNNLAPILADNSLIFVQRNNKKIVNIKYDANSYGYFDSELTVICDHLLDNNLTIVDMAFSQEPYSIIYFVLSDGSMITCTYYQQEQVVAFAKHEMQNSSIAAVGVIPYNGIDKVWLLVNNNINGVDSYYPCVLNYDLTMDDVVTVDNTGSPTNTFSDSRKLYDDYVHVIADGIYLGEYSTNSSGTVILPNDYEVVQMGTMFDPIVTLLPIQFANPNAMLGYNQNINRVALQFLNTQTAKLNDEPIEFVEFGTSVLDEPLPLFTGVKVIDQYGILQDGKEMTITQDEPLAFHLLSILRVIDVNN